MEFDLPASILAACTLLVFLLLGFRRRKLTTAIFFSNSSHLQQAGSSWRVRWRKLLPILRIISVSLLLVAFARPQQGLEVIRTAKEGIAIQMVIDRSSSMKEEMDYEGSTLNRLSVVKQVFRKFILGNREKLRGRSNDMIGLMSFAGFAEENSPLTLDHQSLVNLAQTITPAARIEDGTMIGDGLYYAALRLISVDQLLARAGEKNSAYKVKSKIIILLTDGQQTQGGRSPLEAAEFARENGIKVYTIAITDGGNYQKQNSLLGGFFSLGQQPIDTSLIQKVAEITGGIFAKASSGEALLEIYQKVDMLEKSDFEERFTTYKEQFPVFVAIALSLLLLEIILSQTLFRKIP